jgi:hypothetical protein
MKLGTTAARIDGSASGMMSQIKSFLSGLGWHRKSKVAGSRNQTPGKVVTPPIDTPEARRDGPA